MDRRFAMFAVLVALIFVVNQIIFSVFNPPQPPPAKVAKSDATAKAKGDAGKEDAAKSDSAATDASKAKADEKGAETAKPQDGNSASAAASTSTGEPTTTTPLATPSEIKAAPGSDSPESAPIVQQRGTLGSADPASPYRLLVTWNNRGAAIERVELNAGYHDLDDRSGYLGYLAPIDSREKSGALARVVGPGTPAAAAGIKAEDVITAIGDKKVRSAAELIAALEATEPDQEIVVGVSRGGESLNLKAKLGHRPLNVIRPEFDTEPVEILTDNDHDPLSFLTTIQQFDDRSLANDNKELGGVSLRNGEWEVSEATSDKVQFKRALPKLGLEVTKTYTLAKVPADQQGDALYPAYHLVLDVAVKNVSDAEHKVAYRLDGPTGLPHEGAWYANKVSGAGLRDVVVKFAGSSTAQVSPAELNEDDFKTEWGATSSLDFIAVDAQYFAAAVLPQKKDPADIWFQTISPTKVGSLPKDVLSRLLNVSFRMDSKVASLAPGASIENQFQLFAGPKRPALLSQYGPSGATLTSLVQYGWFWFVAEPMLKVLHFFYAIVGNYGIAIIMLTVLVRLCMFPVSRKQALGAQKMQELQPEMKRINEKYKTEPEKKTRATQELFRQHKYNPLGGCLLAFVQLPIFIGLYRSLMVDVELRQAPLFSENIRWASNLAAPDMFWNWSHIMPDFITHGTGFFALGPYLNILPLFTIGLMIWQQKMFMPPAADEQAALQQKMMQYMMVFMGIMFFKVASGLCVYFIASSLWGICERKLLPKPAPKVDGMGTPITVPPVSSNGNGASGGKKRQRGRK